MELTPCTSEFTSIPREWMPLSIEIFQKTPQLFTQPQKRVIGPSPITLFLFNTIACETFLLYPHVDKCVHQNSHAVLVKG